MKTPSLAVRLFVRGGALLAGLAAEPLRSALRGDGRLVLAESCEGARDARGWPGLIRTGIAEWASLIRAAVSQRFGRPVRVSGGRAGRPSPDRPPRPSRLGQDARDAWRGLRTSRATVVLAVLSLGLGIGVNTAVFSILDALVFRPVPYAEAPRLASLWSYYAPGKFTMKGGFTPALIAQWRTQNDLFDRVEATESKSFIYDDRTGAVMITGAVVTPGLFPMLGVPPREGRIFVETDGRAGSDRLAIISERFWRERLGRERSAIGREIVLDGDRYVVVGIMPDRFRFPDRAHDIWVPYDVVAPAAGDKTPHKGFVPTVRMAPGTTRTLVAEQTMARGADVNLASGGDGQGSARLVAMGELFDDRTSQSLLVLGGAVLFLLLIVCANVANLTLARSMARSRDLAVRVALGASRLDLFRVALLEHVLIGGLGAMLGLGLARAAIDIAVATLPDAMTLQSLNAIDLDGRTLLFLVAVAAGTVVAFGLPPALTAARAPVSPALGRDSRSATGSAGARRFRSVLVVAEMALSIVLLIGAALMTRSLLELEAIDVGVDADGLIAVQVALPAPAYSDPQARRVFVTELLERVRRESWAASVAAGTLPPAGHMIAVGPIEFDDRPGQQTKSALLPIYAAWPGLFHTAGIRLIDGREFRDHDIEGAAIVSKDFATKHWPGRSPIGASFKIGSGSWRRVVGVAAEIRRMSEDDDSREQEIYYPHDQVSGVMVAGRLPSAVADYQTILIRTASPGAAGKAMPGVVHGLDPRAFVSRTTLVAHELAEAIARPRIVFLVMAIFAGVGLVLAAAGLYGVLSYLVSQRMREIGIRLALGASPHDVGRLVLRSGLGLALVGLTIGLAVALGLVRVMRTLLYAVDPFDPVSIGVVISVLMLTAVVASWRPAYRAMQIDPVLLLKAD